jgi:hypothetical protein
VEISAMRIDASIVSAAMRAAIAVARASLANLNEQTIARPRGGRRHTIDFNGFRLRRG